ncbi:hypothetical protein EDD17DRAFT_1505313 [Pisolithus thermaeus]|nr:hypothetical protein EDD17DRAFT_1505313 [Pisolithus thermaeus]
MPWPDFITYQFKLVNKLKADESHYYGPFNALFQHLFPPSEYYQAAPQFKWGAEWQKVPVLGFGLGLGSKRVVLHQQTGTWLSGAVQNWMAPQTLQKPPAGYLTG